MKSMGSIAITGRVDGIENGKSHLKIKQLWCIIYLEVIGIESPIALSN